MTAKALPFHASLRHLRHEAKSLLQAHRDGDPTACETLRLIPRLAGISDEEILQTSVQLQEVQHALARAYGFKSWTELRTQVEGGVITSRNQGLLAYLRDIHEVSTACGTTTYIWGGFTLDLHTGRFLREHKDVDGFVLNMLDVLPDLMARYEARGYATEFRDDIDMLNIRKDGLHATFNRLEIDGETAMWRHIGREGTLFFPVHWLDQAPRDFYEVPVYSAGIKFDYVLKTNIRMLNPEYEPRQREYEALTQLEEIMALSNIDPEEFLAQAWSYNPFWVKQGYPEYAMPTVARPLRPIAEQDAR